MRMEASRYIAAMSEVWGTLLAEHVDDGSGHCRVCRPSRWPCTLHAIAREARLIALPGGGSDPGEPSGGAVR